MDELADLNIQFLGELDELKADARLEPVVRSILADFRARVSQILIDSQPVDDIGRIDALWQLVKEDFESTEPQIMDEKFRRVSDAISVLGDFCHQATLAIRRIEPHFGRSETEMPLIHFLESLFENAERSGQSYVTLGCMEALINLGVGISKRNWAIVDYPHPDRGPYKDLVIQFQNSPTRISLLANFHESGAITNYLLREI